MPTYGFNENDAKRVGRAVHYVERGAQRIVLGGPNADGAAPGVRLLIAKHEGTEWPVESTAVVTIYNGPPGSAASAMTMVAYNEYILFSTDTACTVRWVALGHNGFAWHPVDSQSDCGACIKEIGGVDFRVLDNYQSTAIQIIGHDIAGCVKWFDVFTCATAAT